MADVMIDVISSVGSPYCVSSDDGDRLYEEIRDAVRRGDRIRLSFEGVKDLTTAFLNSAIGQLYGEYSESEVHEFLLPPVGAASHLALLKRVVERAKSFFAEPDRYRTIYEEALAD